MELFLNFSESMSRLETSSGFDPELLHEMTFEGATTYDDTNQLIADHRGAFDIVFCMEVCEHLNSNAMFHSSSNIKTLVKPDATIVFGVPIETGLSGFVKNLYRWTRGGRQNATLGRAVKSLFGLWIPRACSPRGWIGSHLGFDARAFSKRLP